MKLKAIFVVMLLAGIQLHATKLKLVPTFENCSVHVEETNTPPSQLIINYRKQGAGKWLTGHELTNSPNKPVPRGSLFKLTPNTEYEVQCSKKGKIIAKGKFRTWREDVPVKKVIKIDSNEPFLVEEYGTPDGWVKYVPASNNITIEGGYDDEEAILLEGAQYVILEGFKIRGGKRHGIQVKKSHHIRIKNCDIAGFGRKGKVVKKGLYYEPGAKKANNWDAGVYLDLAQQVVIENCYIHDPRGRANSWAYGHPLGPNGIFIRLDKKGGLVIRYNDIIGSLNKRWNDTIESYGNGKEHGGPRYNSDIYGNYLAYSNDDGIELEGGMENLRFYGNKIEGSLCGISTAANLIGPAYIFNNLVTNLGDDRGDGRACVKNGGGTKYSKGMTYFYNNTFFTLGSGITGVGFGSNKNRAMFNGVSRNNILMVSSAGISDMEKNKRCSYDYDLFANVFGGKGAFNTVKGMERNAVFSNPQLVNPINGDFRLKSGSPAIGAGTKVKGLYPDKKNDMGALARSSIYSFMPWRKIDIKADRYQVRIKTSRAASPSIKEVVKLNTQKLKKGQGFKILKNDDFKWFKVSPEKGILNPKNDLNLTVSLSKNHINQSYLAGAFVIKLDSGDSIPVAVHLNVADADFRKYYRAVDCKGADQFKRKTVDGKDCLDFSNKRNQGITIKPNVPFSGKYYLYYNVKCPEPFPLHDSIFVSVNGSELERCGIRGSSNWHWDRKIGNTGYIKLKKGVNTIKVAQREGLFLSGVYLSSFPLFPGDKIK